MRRSRSASDAVLDRLDRDVPGSAAHVCVRHSDSAGAIPMNWLTFVAGAVLSWGVYGAMLHQGQTKLGSPMRALLCVGVAYFLIGVLVPVMVLMAQGQGLGGFTASGA